MSDYTELVKALNRLWQVQDTDLEDWVYGSQQAMHDAAAAIEELMAFDIRQLPEGLYTVKNGVVYTAKVKVSGGNVLNMKTGESHWEDDRIVGGEQVFPKLPKMEAQG